MLRFEERNGIAYLYLKGTIDLISLTDFKNRFQAINLSPYKKIIFNLSELDFVDSSTIGYLLFIFRDLKTKEKLIALSSPKRVVHQTLQLTTIDNYVPVFGSDEEAEKSLRGETDAR